MELEKPSFEKDLWGQCNILHERLNRKIEYYKYLKKMFEPIHNSFSELNKKINATRIPMDLTIPLELYTDSQKARSFSVDIGSKLYGVPLTMKIVKEFISNTVDFNVQTLFHIVTNLENLIKKMRQEKSEYEEFQKSSQIFYESKKAMEKNLKSYHQKMVVAEQSVLDLKKLEIKTMSVNNDSQSMLQSQEMLNQNSSKLINDCIKPFKTYEESRSKANELREDSIKKQKHLLYTYQNIEEELGKVNQTISSIFLSNLKIQKEFIEEKSTEIEEIKNNINVKKDIRQLIIDYTGNETPEEEIPFIGFPTTIDFDKSEDKETYLIYSETVKYIQERISAEFPDYDEKLEREKNDMREIMVKIFSTYSKEGADKILTYIKNPDIHYYFLLLLNNLRTNNRIKQNEELINFLGVILNQILDASEKDLNFDNAKNCMILSQTFFCEKGNNKEKYYLIEKIRKHKWLITKDFWVNFIDKMIDYEITKFVAMNNETTKEKILEGSNDVNDKIKSKVSELLFSQLLPYVNNMNEFKISIKNMVQITDFFCHKFKFLSDEHKESMFGLISEDQTEVNKYRKEFQRKNSLYEKKLKAQQQKRPSKREKFMVNTNDYRTENPKFNKKANKKEKNVKYSVLIQNNMTINFQKKKENKSSTKKKNLNKSNSNSNLSEAKEEPKLKSKDDNALKKSNCRSNSGEKRKSHEGGFFGSIRSVKNKVVNAFKKDDKKDEKKEAKEEKDEAKKEEKKQDKADHKKESDSKKDNNPKPTNSINQTNNNSSIQSNNQPSPFGVVLKKVPTNNANSNNNN